MSYIEMCNKKDRSPGSFSRQIRFKNVELVPGSTDGNGNALKILRFSNLNAHTLFTTSQIFFKN